MRQGTLGAGVAVLALAACSTMSPGESAARALMWDAATKCAAGTSNIRVDRVDSSGQVWLLLDQGGKQDVPAFNRCYEDRVRTELAGRPDLQQWLRERRKN